MTEAARLAAVIIRLIAAGMMACVLIVVVLQLAALLSSVGGEASEMGDLWVQLPLTAVLFLLPGIWLYRNSRELGIRLTRGLE